MRRRVAIVGAGITLFRRRMLESPKELSFEASKMALDSAGLTLKDIQSVVSGSAPDAFDGVHMKGEYYLDGMGAIGKTRTCLRRRRNRGLHPDRRLVERRLRTLRHMPLRCGRKNVPFTSASS